MLKDNLTKDKIQLMVKFDEGVYVKEKKAVGLMKVRMTETLSALFVMRSLRVLLGPFDLISPFSFL